MLLSDSAFASFIEDTQDSSTLCSVDEPCPSRGSILLQLAGLSNISSLKAPLTAESGNAEATVAQGTAMVGEAEDKLTQYAKLKLEVLSQSEESAESMRRIDEALDASLGGRSAHGETHSDSKDEVVTVAHTDAEAVLPAQGSKVKDAAALHSKHGRTPDVSLIEASAKKSPRHSRMSPQDDVEEAGDDADTGEVGTDEGTDEEEEEEEDVEEESEEDDVEEQSEDANTDDVTDEDEEGEDDVLDEDTEDEDYVEPIEKRKKRKVSLTVLDVATGTQEPLDEDGYIDVVSSRNNRNMERFVKRLAEELSFEIVDEGGLKGMVPFYSGLKATQSFTALEAELMSTARLHRGWLKRRKTSASRSGSQSGSRPGKKSRSRSHTKNLLLQTDSTQREVASMPVSLLSSTSSKLAKASRLVHKVPDLALALFGSRAIILLCAFGLVACLFCLDGRKRTDKGVDFQYEDPLNISPMPPSVQQK